MSFRELRPDEITKVVDDLRAQFADGVAWYWHAQNQNPYSLMEAAGKIEIDDRAGPEIVFVAMMAIGWQMALLAQDGQ